MKRASLFGFAFLVASIVAGSALADATLTPAGRFDGIFAKVTPLASTFFTPTCTTNALPGGVKKTVGGTDVYAFYLATIFDGAIDDGGSTSSGDSLILYCVAPDPSSTLGITAMCLSGEPCPWR